MNKKTLFFLGAVGVVAVVAISIQRGKTPHAEPLSPAVASKPAVRPSVPVSLPLSNIVVRAVETRKTDEEMDVEKPSAAAAVRCIIGAETSGSYVESLPTLRRVAESAAEPLANRTVAIGALGTFGDASDVVLLRKLLAANPNPRLVPALNVAVERIEKSGQ